MDENYFSGIIKGIPQSLFAFGSPGFFGMTIHTERLPKIISRNRTTPLPVFPPQSEKIGTAFAKFWDQVPCNADAPNRVRSGRKQLSAIVCV